MKQDWFATDQLRAGDRRAGRPGTTRDSHGEHQHPDYDAVRHVDQRAQIAVQRIQAQPGPTQVVELVATHQRIAQMRSRPAVDQAAAEQTMLEDVRRVIEA